MDNLKQVADAVSGAIAQGKKVEILTSAIHSERYRPVASFQAIGAGLAEVTLKGRPSVRYLIPAGAITGLRLTSSDE